MTSLVRRRLRFPVFSRLTWAWMISAGAGFALAAGLFAAGARVNAPSRVALALGPVEHLAPPEHSQKAQAVPPHDASPALRDGEAPPEPFSTAATDMLADAEGAPHGVDMPDGGDDAADETLDQPGRLVITIDGKPVHDSADPSAPTTPQNASYAPPAIHVAAPDAALEQQTRFGPIPAIAADGRRASRYYALPDTAPAGATRVGLIVGGLGLNAALTDRAIKELPPEVTLSFAPYAKNLDQWTKKARAAGHEIMVELPMESYGGGAAALGPAALLTSRSADQNLQRLDWLLSRFGGYFAATNYLGGKFSANSAALAPVIDRLKALGLAYVDDTGAAQRAAGDHDNAVARVDRIVSPGSDGDDEKAAARDLDDLATIAKRHGSALGKTYAYPASIDAIIDWAGNLDSRHVTLSPASAVIAAR